MGGRVYLYDTTLRDGAQTQGVDFGVADKRAIAEALDGLGIDYVEKRNSLVDAVTLDQVKGQARRLLHPDRLVVTVVGKPQGVK